MAFLHRYEGIPMNKSIEAHCFKLSADQGNALAQFNYEVLVTSGDGVPMNKSLAPSSSNERDEGDWTIPLAENDILEDQQPLSWTFRSKARHQSPDQEHEEDVVAELEKKEIQLLGMQEVMHLKIAANAGLSIGKFHYHLRLDELTSNL
jgi:hypothetical protein